jgi:hypothetical protein
MVSAAAFVADLLKREREKAVDRKKLGKPVGCPSYRFYSSLDGFFFLFKVNTARKKFLDTFSDELVNFAADKCTECTKVKGKECLVSRIVFPRLSEV